jgi:long-chain acyl-CoA synthetase
MLDKSKADDGFPWVAQYPRGVPAKLESVPPISMPDLLDRSAREFGASVALSQGDQRWTYAEMQALVARAARGLQALGVRNGDRVAAMMPNHAAVPIWFFGALSIGAALVSINALFPSGQVEHMLADSGARVMLTLDSPETVGKAMPLVEKGLLDRIVTASLGASELSGMPAGSASDLTPRVISLQVLLNNDGRYDRPALDPSQTLAVLQYTGGTTGTPKGAMLTHANLTTNARQTRMWFPSLVDGSERLLIPLPFSHITGITVCMTFAVVLAAELMVVPRFVPDEALALLRQRKPTFFGGVPTIFIALLMTNSMTADDWKTVKAILCGGAPLPPDVLEKFEKISGEKVRQIYGSTELSPAATIMPANLDEPRGSVGLPIPGTTIEIRDTGDPAKRMAGSESGEIVVVRPTGNEGLLEPLRRDQPVAGRRLLPHRRHRLSRREGLSVYRRPPQGHDHRRRLQHLSGECGSCGLLAPIRRGGDRDRRARCLSRRNRQGIRRAAGRRNADTGGAPDSPQGPIVADRDAAPA